MQSTRDSTGSSDPGEGGRSPLVPVMPGARSTTRLIFLAMREVLSFGFNLAVSFPSDSRGSKAHIVLLPSRIKRWGFHHIA